MLQILLLKMFNIKEGSYSKLFEKKPLSEYFNSTWRRMVMKEAPQWGTSQFTFFWIIQNDLKIKSVTCSSQGRLTGQLDLWNWMADGNMTG